MSSYFSQDSCDHGYLSVNKSLNISREYYGGHLLLLESKTNTLLDTMDVVGKAHTHQNVPGFMASFVLYFFQTSFFLVGGK